MPAMNYEGQVVCGYQPSAIGANPARWPRDSVLTWRNIAKLPGIDDDKMKAVIQDAFNVWSDVCGLQFVEADESNQKPEFLIGVQHQGPGGVLADCELPYPEIYRVRPLKCRIDTADRWSVSSNTPPDRIGLDQVLRHEFGHGIGLDHGGDGMMKPIYSRDHWYPSAWEIGLVQQAYGPPKPKKPKAGEKPDPRAAKQLAEFLADTNGRLVVSVQTGVVVRFPDGREVTA